LKVAVCYDRSSRSAFLSRYERLNVCKMMCRFLGSLIRCCLSPPKLATSLSLMHAYYSPPFPSHFILLNSTLLSCSTVASFLQFGQLRFFFNHPPIQFLQKTCLHSSILGCFGGARHMIHWTPSGTSPPPSPAPVEQIGPLP